MQLGTDAIGLFHSIDWGNFPSYFSGLALLSTLYIISRDRGEKRREQASTIAAWSEPRGDVTVVLVRNASDLPCWRVTITGAAGNKPVRDGSWSLRLSKFDDDITWMFKPLRLSTVGPGQTIEAAQFSEHRRAVRVDNMYFTDAAGRKWVRRRGDLARVRRELVSSGFRRARYWYLKKRARRNPTPTSASR